MTITALPPQAAHAIAKAKADRDAGFARAEAAKPLDKALIDEAIAAMAATGRPFSANDLRDHLPEVAPALMGSRFFAAAAAGLIRRVGLTTSTKRNTHSKPVTQWIGTRP